MLRVFFGNDTIKVRESAFNELDNLRAEGISATVVEENNYEAGLVSDAVNSQSLFGGKQVYLFDTPSQEEKFYEEVVANLAAMQAQENIFLILESNLLAAEKKRFEKHADSIEEYKATAKERFNSFALADALVRKDRKALWMLFHEAVLAGIAAEELVGILWWQLKTLRLAAITKNAEEAGLKDFPYQKARRSLAKFGGGELENLSTSLLTLTHDSRRGFYDIDQALERWILRL
jgi:DNA polymerase III delta subunit